MYVPPFKDRLDAGFKLAQAVKLPPNAVVFAIPRGGVPVGYALSKTYRVPFDIVVVRKLYIPWEPEAGFGAITPDGQVILNPKFEGYIPPETVAQVSKEVLNEVLRRNEVYRGGAPYKPLNGKIAVVVDDGFASGYTAIAAYQFLKRLNPDAIIAVTPVCPRDTKELLKQYFDEVYCLIESNQYPFAVASFYEDFHDMSDEEVLSYIEDLKREGLLWFEQ